MLVNIKVQMATAIALLACLCVGGVLVFGSYAQLYLAYTRRYSEAEKRRVWAIWYHEDIAWLGVLSGALSAVGFIYFSIFICMPDNNANPPLWLICPYSLFLLFSALYAPLMELERQCIIEAWVILLDLFIVSANVITLSVWTQTQFSWAEEPFLNVSILWIALHCTLLDLGLWGYTWSNGWVWDEDAWSGTPKLVTLAHRRMHEEDGAGIGETEEDPRLMI